MSKVFFTSDTHFGHAKIIEYSKRPFATAEQMDEEMIRRWNETVGPNDIVYHLGDFAVGGDKTRPAEYYLKRLNGRIILIEGNHEDRAVRVPELFEKIVPYLEIKVFYSGKDKEGKPATIKQSVTLCHYAMKVWNKSHHGAWQLYGHSHGSLPDPSDALQLDVGVDCWDFRPVSVEQIRDRMAKKTWKPIDHHTGSVDGPRGVSVRRIPAKPGRFRRWVKGVLGR